MVLRRFAIGILMTASAFAQMSSFPKASYFRETFRKPDTKVVLQPPARLADFVKDGKLELSLKDYLELVMANNTQVITSYLTLETSRNSILSAYGSFDPIGSATFVPSWTRQDPQRNMWTGDPGYTKTHSDSFPITLGWNQKLQSGQTISLSGGGSKSVFDGSPSFRSNLGFSITQPLIQNRGSYITRVSIMSAQSRYKGQEWSIRNTLQNYVNSAEQAYWTAVQARETITSTNAALKSAQASYDFIHQQLSLGAVSELDTYYSESQLAQAKLNLVNAQFSLQNAEEALRQQIAADLDPTIRNLPLNLTEPVDVPTAQVPTPEREQAVQTALATRFDLKNLQNNLDIDELTLASARNGLLPNLSFQLSYSGSGSGSLYNGGFGSGYTGSPIPGGLGDALSQMFLYGNPVYRASLSLSLPIRSRSAAASMANAIVAKKQDTLNIRNLQQSIRLSTLQALNNLDSAKQNLVLAQLTRDATQKDDDAMHKKYELGTEIQQNVISADSRLASADLQLVRAKIGLRTALLSYYAATGELLDKRGIVISTPGPTAGVPAPSTGR